MDASKAALVLIEFQNDFTSEGGSLHGAVAEVMEATHQYREQEDTAGQFIEECLAFLKKTIAETP